MMSSCCQQITYSGSTVLVRAKNKTGASVSYSAKYVLVTVPLGVLKKASIAFTPPLPATKLSAINTELGMGLLNKLVLVWPSTKVFWDKTAVWVNR
jgi:monoamine oxidase